MDEQRTLQQNKALHKFFELLANELNEAGLDMRKILKPEIDIPWTTISVKNFLWRPIQEVMLGKHSTTELDKLQEIDKIYETLNRFLGEKWGLHVEFPSIENYEENETKKNI